MKYFKVLQIVVCLVSLGFAEELTSEEREELTEKCCTHGEAHAMLDEKEANCDAVDPPDDIDASQTMICLEVLKSCCRTNIRRRKDCTEGMQNSRSKRCQNAKTDIGKSCCEECSIGTFTGESMGKDGCGGPPGQYLGAISAIRKSAYYKCCVEAAALKERTTSTTRAPVVKCKPGMCQHNCSSEGGTIRCSCWEGYRLQRDNKTCKDINECAEATDDLCTAGGTVCHNTAGSFKCVPLKKRDVSGSLTCPSGFQPNFADQVCDDINECQLPSPPCPKPICKNIVGGYLCAGKPGTPGKPEQTQPAKPTASDAKNELCPPGFRAGEGGECVDVDECQLHVDDCQRLSQHCINTHGSFFCQDHVSKRCKPGFVVNIHTGICEDINECDESPSICKPGEVCVNMAGAYSCTPDKAFPAYPSIPFPPARSNSRPQNEKCQEGSRLSLNGFDCEDINECAEGSHLCDQHQDCHNTFGGHECRCKAGFELDASEACVDVDECALKLDNCPPNKYCENTQGSFVCKNIPPSTLPPLAPSFEYEYYYSDEEEMPLNKTTSTTLRPSTTTKSTTARPTTPRIPAPPRLPPKPRNPPRTPKPTSTTVRPTSTPYTNKPTATTNTPVSTTKPGPRLYGPRINPTNSTPNDSRTDNRRTPYDPRRPVYRPDLRPLTPYRPQPDFPSTPTYSSSEAPISSTTPDSEEAETSESTLEKPNPDDIDLNNLYCLDGYEKNEFGDCVDIDECKTGHYICGVTEQCANRPGGYACDCRAGMRRNAAGECESSPRVFNTNIRRTTTSSTTTVAPRRATTAWSPFPRPPLRPWYTPKCERGYVLDSSQGRCVDIDECATMQANCSPNEDCVNTPGGYQCVCGHNCHPEASPAFQIPSTRPALSPGTSGVDTSIVTVGTQFGQRGQPRVLRPTTTRLPNTGAIVKSCPWGYRLTTDQMCHDIDECAKGVSECGPTQQCENFPGGYACACPAGHRLVGQKDCQDFDECSMGSPCSYNSKCINIAGSYRCQCDGGFRNAPANDKVCVDVDECSERPRLCEQGCANSWGGYRCYCHKGYRLHTDNRTCVDIDECEEWGAVRLRGRLCGGVCVNTAGSYRCACPKGYRLADDQRTCVDIDECEMGTATCARTQPGTVCQNTRGGYHCHRIHCPPGYRLEAKHKCTRQQRSCPVGDWNCLQQPSSYSYNFITFISNVYLPHGSVDLFTMHGPVWVDAVVNFEMRMVKVDAPSGVAPVDLSCFDLRPMNNICVVSLRCSPSGPQVAELELSMTLHQRGQFAGSAVARLVVIVSQYDF